MLRCHGTHLPVNTVKFTRHLLLSGAQRRESTEENLSKYFKLHLERGISYLTGTNFIKSLDDLLCLALEA